MICLVCQLPNRTPERGLVCNPDRAGIARHLREIGERYQRIPYQTPRGAGGTRPTGKPASRMPLAVDQLDLTMPARSGGLTKIGKELAREFGDQTGELPVAFVLGQWVQVWRSDFRFKTSNPVPTVPVLVRWLATWLPDACDVHPHIDEFAAAMRELNSKLRAVCGETEPRPERVPVPCPHCDLLALRRTPDDAYPIRCISESCEYAGTEEEFQQYVGLCLAAVNRGDFPPREPLDMVVIWHNTGELERITA